MMDREEYEARMARQRRQLEDMEIDRSEALFSTLREAMKLEAANRDSRLDQDWRANMLRISEVFEANVRQVLHDTNVVLQRDLD